MSKGDATVKNHRVKQGECLSSIAAKYGLDAQSIWLDSANQTLKDLRKTPDILLPGDVLKIPDIDVKKESASSDNKHRYLLKNRTFLHIKLVVDEHSLAGEEYDICIEDHTTHGTIGGDGKIDMNIPPDASSGHLTILGRRFFFDLGNLDPADSVTGIQARLNQLGYRAGAIDNDCGPQTKACLSAFQKEHDIQVTGEVDNSTIDKIKQAYGA